MNNSPLILPIRPDVVPASRPPSSFLAVLLEIYRRATALGFDPRKRALAVNTLRAAGADERELADLVWAGVLGHWVETTKPDSTARTFLPARGVRWRKNSCLMLTPAGAERVARQIEEGEACTPATFVAEADTPSWRSDYRELWFGGRLYSTRPIVGHP
jgi:hypothetical protein